MPFTNEDFPNKVFENTEDFKLCVSLRDKLKEDLKSKVRRNAFLVEVAAVIKRDSPLLNSIIELIKRTFKDG
jgi:hypothetical protein